jgi:Protein of unknown function (DUF1176)
MRALLLTTSLAAVLAACGQSEPAPDAKAPAASPSVSAATAGPAIAQPAMIAPATRTFRDWQAVCDNGNACVAWAGSDTGWIRVALDAGPQAVPTISAGSWALGEVGEDPKALALRIDDRPFAVRSGPRDAANAAAGESRARAIVAALAAARSVEITSGAESESLPAAGASAAFLWIDERQGRLGTTTALIRRGDQPASAVPAAPALPRIRPAPAIDQGPFRGGEDPQGDDVEPTVKPPASIEALAEVRQCRADTNEFLRTAILAVKLGPDAELWGIPCDSGAYNATYRLYVSRAGGVAPRPAVLPTAEPLTEGDLGGAGTWLVNPNYDVRTQTLTVFPRGRGLGDCGTITQWVWTGAAFALSEQRTMGECSGMNPDYWPTTWRTAR